MNKKIPLFVISLFFCVSAFSQEGLCNDIKQIDFSIPYDLIPYISTKIGEKNTVFIRSRYHTNQLQVPRNEFLYNPSGVLG